MATRERAVDLLVRSRSRTRLRFFRGLALTFALSFVNFVGLALTARSLGGVHGWTAWQFAGLFGMIEAASGLASVVLPNVWKLPIVEARTSRRTAVLLAASSLFLPRWGGLARTGLGVLLLAAAALDQGTAAGTPLLIPVLLAWAVIATGLSLVVARAGVARPDLDVLTVRIDWRDQERTLEPLSLGASLLQFVLGVLSLPMAAILSPGVLFRPGLEPSAGLVLGSLLVMIVVLAAVCAAWSGPMALQAPRLERQRA
jgi:hypothetical protein